MKMKKWLFQLNKKHEFYGFYYLKNDVIMMRLVWAVLGCVYIWKYLRIYFFFKISVSSMGIWW